LLPVLHWSDRWPTPDRPVTPVRPVDKADQAGGCSSRTTSVPESPSDFSRPWNKNTSKTQPVKKKNPTQSLTKHLQTCQELTSNNTTQRRTDQVVHPRQIPQRAHNSQEHRSDRVDGKNSVNVSIGLATVQVTYALLHLWEIQGLSIHGARGLLAINQALM
jgi:hypothetical protein